MSTELAERNGDTSGVGKRPSAFESSAVGASGLLVRNGAELWSLAQAISKSGLAPKGIDQPTSIMIALQMGMELGLPPMAALQNIAIVNGRPSLWGDAQLAVCRATGEVEEFAEWYEQGGKRLPRNPVDYTDDTVGVCRVKRRGQEPIEIGFSVADAKRANLWGKQGPWTQYPFRMLRSRARSYALRDTFGDALRGMMSSDEAADIGSAPMTVNVAPTKSLAESIGVNPDTGELIEENSAEDGAKSDAAPEARTPATSPAAASEPQTAESGAARAELPETPADKMNPLSNVHPADVETLVDLVASHLGKTLEETEKWLKTRLVKAWPAMSEEGRAAWWSRFRDGKVL
jgi:hypothetical protein